MVSLPLGEPGPTVAVLRAMRQSLEQAIAQNIEGFTRETGVSVTSVELTLLDSSTLASPRQSTIVGVQVRLEL